MAAKNMPASMIMTRIGGKDYPLKSVPNCKTCQSVHRMFIENALITGRTYKAIERSLPDETAAENPTSDNISAHYKNGHMPLPQEVQRRIIERRATDIGRNLEDAAEMLVDKYTVAEMIVHKGAEKILTGDVDPNVAETLAAIKLLHDFEKQNEINVDQEAWIASVQVMMELAHEVMDDEQWSRFGRQLATNPLLNALAKKQRGEVEGEVVETQ